MMMAVLSYVSLATIHGLFYLIFMIKVKLVSIEILKIIVYHVTLINSEFLILMKIIVNVALDFMIIEKTKENCTSCNAGLFRVLVTN